MVRDDLALHLRAHERVDPVPEICELQSPSSRNCRASTIWLRL
jgi:hypothetical protein